MPVFGIDETNPTESYGSLQARLPDISDARGLSMIRPDRLQDLDVTELNLMKQKYVKPVEVKTQEDFLLYKGVLDVIQDHIQTPFTIRERGTNVEKEVTENVTPRKKYLVIHISECFEVSRKYFYPAEFAVAEFSVFNGVGDGVSGMVDIGKVPSGWGSAELDRRKLTCNPPPSFDDKFHPYHDALKLIEDFCRQHFKDDETVIVFALKENIVVVNSGLDYLREKTKEKDPEYVPVNFCVLPFTCLLQALVNESPLVKDPDEEENEPIIRHESNVQDVVDDMTYAYAPELACDYHSRPENESGVQYCSENIVKRTIYNSCLFLKKCWSFTPTPNHHWPRYYQTLRTVTKSKGFKVYEPEQTSRFAQVPRFSGSDTMSDRLGWTSGESSCGSSVGSSSESVISADGSDSSSVRIKVLDQDPQSVYKEQEYGRRLKTNRRLNSAASQDTMSECSSFTSSSLSSVSDDHSENASLKNNISEFRSPKSDTGAGGRANRGRGCRVAMKSLKDIKLPGSPLQALPEEESASYDGELESASSSIHELPSDFVRARLWTPSVESSVSVEDSPSYRTRGRGRSLSSRQTNSGGTFASGVFSSDVTGPYLDWGRTFRKPQSTASADSFDDSASIVGVYGIGGRVFDDDEDKDGQFDSITLVNAPHAHGTNDDENGSDF